MEDDVNEVVYGGVDNQPFQSFQFILYCGEEEIELDNVRTVTISSNFIGSVSDVINVDCLMGNGDFTYDVLPYKNNLYMHMLVTYIDSKGEEQNFKRLLHTVITNKESSGKTVDKRLISKEDMNKENPTVVKFACYDLEIMTMKKVGSELNVKGTTLLNAMKANFGHYVKKADIKIDGEDLTLTTNIFHPDNDFDISNITVDQASTTDIDLTTVPIYLQDKYGVYNSGLVCYYQNIGTPTFYVRPQLDPRMIDKLPEEIVDIFIPNNVRTIENCTSTYVDSGGILKIVSPSIDKFIDDGENRLEDKGKAIAFRDNEVTRRSAKISIDGDTVTNLSGAYTVQGSRKIDDKPAKIKNYGSASNLYAKRSLILMNESRAVPLTWRSSCHFIIKPSMPLRVHYEDNENDELIVKTYTGNIAMINTFISFKGNELFSNSEIVALLLDEEEVDDESGDES